MSPGRKIVAGMSVFFYNGKHTSQVFIALSLLSLHGGCRSWSGLVPIVIQNTDEMIKKPVLKLTLLGFFVFLIGKPGESVEDKKKAYVIGVDDVLTIAVLKPEEITVEVTVAPDGKISFPYIGQVEAKDLTLSAIENDIQTRLSKGYFKYPIVSVALRESRSRRFFVYGEVVRPGPYFIDEYTTVLKAISMAGGFTRFGSSSRVKVLRNRSDKKGYEVIKVKIKQIMDGNSKEDFFLRRGDIVIVSEGIF